MMDANQKQRALARIASLKQEAEELTTALGLPPETKYDVLSVLYTLNPSPAGFLQQTVQETQPESSLQDGASLKARIFQLSNDFLNTRMKGQVAAFRVAWEKLKVLPLETLGQLGRTPAASQGLGFAGGGQQVLSVVSTISWAVTHWPSLSQTNTPEKLTALIVKEAQARGCSDAVSYVLANYLQAHLTNS